MAKKQQQEMSAHQARAEEIRQRMLKSQSPSELAKHAGELEKHAASGTTRATERNADDDPVADMNATDAVESIQRMRSADKLKQIVASDSRSSVKAAAQKRLDEIG